MYDTTSYINLTKKMTKISTPILWETTMEDFIPKIIEFWKTAEAIKKHYPSVWKTLSHNHKLDYAWNKLSDELLKKKLEVMIMQDEELRTK